MTPPPAATRSETRLEGALGIDPPAVSSDEDTHLPEAAKPSPLTGPLAIGQQFGPRYRIIRLLGIGGMGAVYQAWDAELEVVVAIKVIRPEVTSNPLETQALERRFKQELLLARQVTHKNVVRIHDLGEIDGIKYITMSYIDGSDLATTLKNAGKLAVPAALRIVREIASGLLAAHEAGVVHRDLKPANIMVEGEHAVIMDFGIARSFAGPLPGPLSAGVAAGALQQVQRPSQQTLAGTIVGTIAYMAPEQARGEAVDQRADIYALGLIAMDMLAGPRVRGSRLSAVEELQRRMVEAPAPLRTFEPSIPPALERIVSRCVMPDPAQRFQTTQELMAALNALDDHGVPIPLVRRLTPRLIGMTAAVVIAMLAGTYFVTRRAIEPPVEREPVSVLIADFQNNTNDPTFDRSLELMLRRALEGASFISVIDRNRIRNTLGVAPPQQLDETAARELAVKQGLGVVLAGSIDPQGNGFALSLRAVQAFSGNVIADLQRIASDKEHVLESATNLAAQVRSALGDETSESDQMFAMASLSATSLDVVRHYTAAQGAMAANRFEEARESAAKTVEIDPKFGIGYQLLSVAARNLGRIEEAEKYSAEALKYLDTMTERERLSTRGLFFRLAGDYEQCIKEYGELVNRYAADIVGRNQRALCLSKLRRLGEAVEQIRPVVKLLPNRTLFRDNLALYASYAGDFQTAEQEARTVGDGDPHALLALAFAQLGNGQLTDALATYEKISSLGALGASLGASGLGDLAALEGRYSDAVRIFEEGAGRDLAAKNPDSAASKLAAAAFAELGRARPRQAIALAQRALATSKMVKIRFLAARTFIAADAVDRARPLIDGLAADLQSEPRAYAKILEAEMALKAGNAREAVRLASEANTLLDTWSAHFVLGRAYLALGDLVSITQADSAFDRCIKRRGEALSLFLDEEPTYAAFPAVYYYQGQVREAMKTAGFAESYRTYLTFRGRSTEDPLVPDLRRRTGN